jgi:hypothetical protein
MQIESKFQFQHDIFEDARYLLSATLRQSKVSSENAEKATKISRTTSFSFRR